MRFKTYLVGGAVRDEVMGKPSKDLDFVMLAPSFDAMREQLLADGCKIFVEKPEYLVIRAHHPKLGAVDFAVARKDGLYKDGRHPDSTSIATDLTQDLARRDFTCNAMAKDVDTGAIIDPFGGQEFIKAKVLGSVGNPNARFQEDRLRVFRALRFATCKGFELANDLAAAIAIQRPHHFANVSSERIREELTKMFAHDGLLAIYYFNRFPHLWELAQSRGIWLKPTLEQR
jgi:tRNA nucleotidyltransferase (CCA-adding enzyme)